MLTLPLWLVRSAASTAMLCGKQTLQVRRKKRRTLETSYCYQTYRNMEFYWKICLNGICTAGASNYGCLVVCCSSANCFQNEHGGESAQRSVLLLIRQTSQTDLMSTRLLFLLRTPDLPYTWRPESFRRFDPEPGGTDHPVHASVERC